MADIALRIVGTHLPGLRCAGYDGVHLGIQRGRDIVDLTPADVEQVVFDLQANHVTATDGSPDLRGPYVHGRRGERFLYLSWPHPDPDGAAVMFRRAKLHLDAVTDTDLEQAAAGGVLEGALGLTDAHGGPLCAAVRPPRITWRVTT